VVQSDFGVDRTVNRVGLANSVVDAVPRDVVASRFAFIGVADGTAGTIHVTTVQHAVERAEAGQWPCALCGVFVSVSTQGVEWHMKNVHGTTRHSDAYDAASAAQRALVKWRPNPVAPPAHDNTEGSDISSNGAPHSLSMQLENGKPMPQPLAPTQADGHVGSGGSARRLTARDMASAQLDPGDDVHPQQSIATTCVSAAVATTHTVLPKEGGLCLRHSHKILLATLLPCTQTHRQRLPRDLFAKGASRRLEKVLTPAAAAT
jgi:hypothetical protein